MAAGSLNVAVVGLGRAGRARVAALEAHPRARLAAVVRRSPGPGEPSFVDILEDPAVDAAILCTPNLAHAPAARALLEAGKHVAVEFPLAATAEEGRAILTLAERAGRIAHVEHIELLSPSQRLQRERAAGLGAPRGGQLHFTAAAGGWISAVAEAGSPALRAVARLHRLVDLFGEAELQGARLEGADPSYRLEVELSFPGAAGSILLVEERGPDLERATHWAIQCANGLLDDPPPGSPGALFAEDLDHFIRRVEGGGEPYVSNARVLHVLGLVDQIDGLLDRE